MKWIFDIVALGTAVYLVSALRYGVRKRNYAFAVMLGVLMLACVVCAFIRI